MTPQEKNRIRLRHLIAHCAEHMQDHAREIEASYAGIGDPVLCGLLDRAVVEMARSRVALEAVLARIDGMPEALRPGGYALRQPGAGPAPVPALAPAFATGDAEV